VKIHLSLLAVAIGIALTFSPAGHAQQKLGNQDIVNMVKAGLAEEVILTMINSQPAQFAVTPDDIIALKKDGVSDKIIAAMVRPSQPAAPSATVQPANTAASPPRPPSADKPNDVQILSAIRSDPNRNNPQSPTALVMSTTPLGSRNTMFGRVTKLDNIDITVTGFRLIGWGEYNNAAKYWPVDVCVNGTADDRVFETLHLSPSERSEAGASGPLQFQTRTRYRLFKDDFGGLKAEQMLVSEWKPQDSICPAPTSGPDAIGNNPTRSAFGTRTAGGPETLAMLAAVSQGDPNSSAFGVHRQDISATFDAVWNKVTERLTKNKDRIVVSDRESGLIVTALTHHFGFPPQYSKYCVAFDKITEDTTRVSLKLLSYANTNTKFGGGAVLEPNSVTSVNRAAEKFLDELMK
jgi:hypothetical protein